LRAAASFALVLLTLSGAASAVGAGRMFCCNDEHGRPVCADILPQVCYGRAYREISETGMTSRRVEAPLTAEQRAQRAIEEQRRKEEEATLKEQRRKDQALLDTYGSEQDIEIMRGRAAQEVRQSIKNAEGKISEARQLRKKFEDEAEFYKKKRLPIAVAKGLHDADDEIKTLESVIEAKNKELEVIRAKYDADRRRFLELQHRSPPPR